MMSSLGKVWASRACAAMLMLGLAAGANAANVLQSLNAVQQGDAYIVRAAMKEPVGTKPTSFSVTSPSRVVIDLADTDNGIGQNIQRLSMGDLNSVNIVQGEGRLRLVINMLQSVKHDIKVEGSELVITMRPSSALVGSAASQFAKDQGRDGKSVNAVSFRRGPHGEGKLIFDLSDPATVVDVRQKGSQLVVDLPRTVIAEQMRRRYEVSDFATPVTAYTVNQTKDGVQVTLMPKGLWEHSAYQTDNQFVLEVKQLVEDPNKLVQGTKQGYQGERLSLNFQNVDVRRLLQVIGEFTGMNIIVSDTVAGSITLRLNDVPWDQALDIVLQQKSLDMRKNGNVVLVAPRDELATKEKLDLEAKKQISDLEPVRTESIQLHYQKAEEVKKLLTDDKQPLLSKRGTAVVDARTNMLFVQDTPSRIDDVRALIAKIDVPVRQVLIEARIVEASDTFARNLGVRLGIVDLKGAQGGRSVGGQKVTVGGDMSTNAYLTGQSSTQPPFSSTYGVNLPAAAMDGGATNPGALSFTLFNAAKTSFLNLELSALEADGRGKVISSPRVMTADQNEAFIEQGVEIPYLSAASSGATQIQYKKAVLSLKVKPQITPEGKITMKVEINKDSPNTELNTGAGLALNTKKVKTEVLVDNGGTVVIGGIYEQDSLDRTRKIPVLGDIPYIGWAFKNNEISDKRSELMVFITPRVVSDALSVR